MSDKPVENISVKAMCLVVNNGKLLVNRGYDKAKKQIFCRLIGGKVSFGEKSIDTIKREIKEELNCDITKLQFLSAREEIFTYEGKRGHEVIFLYTGIISDEWILNKKMITNPDSEDFPAVWIPVTDLLEDKVILYPSFNYKKIFSEIEKLK